jgi:predicted SprT family Zn-dependent metalloprotease
MNKLPDIRKFAEELMDKHLGGQRYMWDFKWMTSSRRLGQCRGTMFGGSIELNEDYAMIGKIEDITKTILHEIAHAMTPGHGHDRIWQLTCLSIGGDGARLCSNDSGRLVAAQNAKYVATCPTCGYKEYINRMGKAAKAGKLHCGTCSRKHGFSDANRFTFVINY